MSIRQILDYFRTRRRGIFLRFLHNIMLGQPQEENHDPEPRRRPQAALGHRRRSRLGLLPHAGLSAIERPEALRRGDPACQKRKQQRGLLREDRRRPSGRPEFAYIGGGGGDAIGELKELPSPKTGAEAYKQANLAIIDMKIQANHFNDDAAGIGNRDGITLERIDIVFRKGLSEGLLLKPEMVNSWSPEKLEEIKKENTP
jgi:hypothetical protein